MISLNIYMKEKMLLNQGKLEISKMRDIQQMRRDGMDLSTTSNEVAKMWDAITYQKYGFFDAPEVDGIHGCIEKIRSIDPHCPLLQTLLVNYGMKDFESEFARLKCDYRDQLRNDTTLDRKWTSFEKDQVLAHIYNMEGYYDLAEIEYSKAVAKNPLDIISLSTAFPVMLLNGTTPYNSILAGYTSKVLPKDNIYYSFVTGLEAFGLEEKGQLDLALKMATKSLEICHWNTWAAHTVAHVFDAKGQPSQGLAFMDKTRNDWTPCNALACHNNWHAGVFHLDNNNIKEALHVWDTEVFTRLNEQFSYFQMSDAVALLTRLEMEQCSSSNSSKKDCDLSRRWNDLFDTICNNIELESPNNFYDAHLALAMMSCGKLDLLTKMHDRSEEWIAKYENKVFEEWEIDSIPNLHSKSNEFVTKSQVLIPLLKALLLFKDGEYQTAAKMLYPLRKKLRILGGSNAQNDLFYQVLATSLLMAGDPENIAFLKMLLFERQDQRTVYSFSERMQRRIIDNH